MSNAYPVTTPYHEMPLEVLVADFSKRADSVIDPDNERVDFTQAGYMMRSYAGLFHGNGPLQNEEAFYERFSDQGMDAISGVVVAANRLIEVSLFDDSLRIGEGYDFNLERDGYHRYASSMLSAVSSGLEMVRDMPAALRQHALDNELNIVLGNIDPTETLVLRMYGPSEEANQATKGLVDEARENFPAVITACDMLIPADSTTSRDAFVHYIAGVLGSTWRHPDYTGTQLPSEM